MDGIPSLDCLKLNPKGPDRILKEEGGIEDVTPPPEAWDPLKSDYESVDNRPDFRTDDADLVNFGFSTKSQYRRVCKWFRCVMIYGTQEYDDIQASGTSSDKWMEEFLEKPDNKEFFGVFNDYYNRKPFVDFRSPPALSEIVAVRVEKVWYRGRVESFIPDKKYEVFLADVGHSVSADLQDLRLINPKFLHSPFQAVVCSIKGLETRGMEFRALVSLKGVHFEDSEPPFPIMNFERRI